MVDRTTLTMDRDLSHGGHAANLLNSLDRADWEEYSSWCAGATVDDVTEQEESERDRETARLIEAAKEKEKSDRQVAFLVAVAPYLPDPGDSAELQRFKTEAIRELCRQVG